MKNIIQQKLNKAFSPEFLQVIDESSQHAGHSGWREGGNTHFKVEIKAASLAGKTRVAQHQAIMRELKEEFADTLHALSIDIMK
ncbi:MAG: BolA family transcriptional regulator [Rhizobiales bacterium]|nr:BolA family transcriptional regulator [Hyphomicrobiales bacterium]NRB15647.1 BolA family transcriptional regulator [Hyphomicrobiales bacterium]